MLFDGRNEGMSPLRFTKGSAKLHREPRGECRAWAYNPQA